MILREEIDTLTERMTASKDSLVLDLREKEHELEDAMMIVSLLQEQIKNKGGEDTEKITGLLEEIKDKNSLLPKVSFLQNGFYQDTSLFKFCSVTLSFHQTF
jgi:hypothetical protein